MEKDSGRIEKESGRLGHTSMTEPEFPQLTAIRDFDRQQHIERSLEAGMSREEAERHADEHLKEWSPLGTSGKDMDAEHSH